MNEQPTPRSLIVDLGVLLVSEVLGYIAFLVNVPFALSLVATIFVIVIVLQTSMGSSLSGFSPGPEFQRKVISTPT